MDGTDTDTDMEANIHKHKNVLHEAVNTYRVCMCLGGKMESKRPFD